MKKYNNIYCFINDYENKVGDSYFSHDSLKFFGERVSEMYLLKNTVMIKDCSGSKHKCYVLSSLQRNNPKGATRAYNYFDVETLKRVL